MDSSPLVAQRIDAGGRFLSEFTKRFPVQTAFWLKEGEDDDWYLYLVSDQISDENFDLAYAEVVRVATRLQDPWFDPFHVKVLGTDDPLARAFLGFQQKHPQSLGWYPAQLPRNINTDETYIYPNSSAVTP